MMTLSKETIEDIVRCAYGIHRLNAKTAVGYAFSLKNGKVYEGEYIFQGEEIDPNYDGYLGFEDKEIRSLVGSKVFEYQNIKIDIGNM